MLVTLAACGPAGPEPVVVFAAASLREPVDAVADRWEAAHGVPVHRNFAGSNTLALQIAAAPVADVFLSADPAWADHVADRTAARVPFVRNRLVVIARADAGHVVSRPADLADLDFRHLAVGHPEAVPAGRYAKAWLSSQRVGEGTLYDAVASRLAPALDVRAATAMVEANRDVIGIVYATDARASDGVRVLHEIENGPDVQYVAARLSRGSETASSMFDALTGPGGLAVFAAHGFVGP